jgi:hypothetical protein
MYFRYIPRHINLLDDSVDPTFLRPRLLPGETVQGLLTAAHTPQHVYKDVFDRRKLSRVLLHQLL